MVCVWLRSVYPPYPPTHCAPFGSARMRNERDLRNRNRVDEMAAVEAEERGEDGQTDGLPNVAARVRIPGHVRDLRRAAGLLGAWSRREVVNQAAQLKAEPPAEPGMGPHHDAAGMIGTSTAAQPPGPLPGPSWGLAEIAGSGDHPCKSQRVPPTIPFNAGIARAFSSTTSNLFWVSAP
jgi:hypothetical protein